MPKKLPTYEEVLAALCAVTRAAEQHREWCRIDGSRPDIPASVVKKARELIDRATLAKARIFLETVGEE